MRIPWCCLAVVTAPLHSALTKRQRDLLQMLITGDELEVSSHMRVIAVVALLLPVVSTCVFYFVLSVTGVVVEDGSRCSGR
jgi:hypothetical protein